MHVEPEFDERHVPARDLRAERCPPVSRRRRRRGPRSLQALVRRERLRFTPPSGTLGESGVALSGAPDGVCSVESTQISSKERRFEGKVFESTIGEADSSTGNNVVVGDRNKDGGDFPSLASRRARNLDNFSERVRIWSVNVRKLLRRKAELEARLSNANVDIIMLQETWLADDVEEVRLDGFYLVGRLDRSSGPKIGYGGVAVYAKNSLTNIALLAYSEGAERMWCILHTNVGAFLLGNWYRAPDAGDDSICSLPTELASLRDDVVGVILAGDVNIHHRKLLRHSRENSAIGERLWNISKEESLKQLVSDPTRGDYLLDIVLADVGDLLKVTVLPSLADHRVVSMDIYVFVTRSEESSREVWDFKNANWDGLRHALKNRRWIDFLDDSRFDDGVDDFCDNLSNLCASFIPKKIIFSRQRSHPWLDDECFEAIEAKCLATGDEFLVQERECAEVLTRKFVEYQVLLKERIRQLPRSSKLWWRLNRELLNKKSKNVSIPPLKGRGGDWILKPEAKANLLADTFRNKCCLPPGDWRFDREESRHEMASFLLIRSRSVFRIIQALKVDKASGPDKLPIRIFKECVRELAPIIAVLTRFLLRCRQWPRRWRLHWVHPFYKKGSVSNPSNYRGVHLTNVLSKIVERAVSRLLTPFLDRTGAFGSDQWGFRPKRSCRELVALFVLRWIWALDCGFKVAIYLSDISGAFDKVDREILVMYLRNAGVTEALCDFLCDYLATRSAVVIVQGKHSRPFAIANQVFQGTVLGPPLWNVFFKDVDTPIVERCFRGAKFADDLSAFKNFESSTANTDIFEKLRDLQSHVHAWGTKHRVTFDASKEHFCILHREDCQGDVFKLLGTLIDPKLVMEDEVRRIRRKSKPKIKAILSTRSVYSVRDLIQQFKTHVWCLLEASNIAIYHVSATHLESIDVLQSQFVREIGLSEEQAFLEHNLAPLKLRRDISALGLLHKIQLGEAHPDFGNLFTKRVGRIEANTRHGKRRHGKQFEEIAGNSFYFNHSVFGAVRVYNVLPEYAVNSSTVSDFQSFLTKDARFKCRIGDASWVKMYCCRHRS